MNPARTYDVVVFGATGFTGQLVAEYLARNAGPEVRWAIAGRNRERLHGVQRHLAMAHPGAAEVPVLQADVGDRASLLAMAREARVVLTTVGPYVRFGEPVVRACVEAGADYVDITGEPEFVSEMVREYDAQARANGVRVVHCCGFDSIPADLGALYTVLHLPADVPVRIDGFVEAQGTFSGGTWQSAVTAMGRMRQTILQRGRRRSSRPAGARRVRSNRPSFRYERNLQGWVYPLPTIDGSIVRRSARALARYGPDFGYAHLGMSRSLPSVVKGALGIGAVLALAQFPPTRRRLMEYRKSGDGPSQEERASSWFKVTFIGTAGAKRVVVCVSGGDPGYDETAKMVSESALCLAFDDLPARAGVITTAEAMGEPLIERLHQAGLRFDVLAQA